ncbi:MAG: MFS transporter [Candidatus Micrarchaeota archaeon]|nr:MFS transporter [Candidatus Micrarchaeota archaeon]
MAKVSKATLVIIIIGIVSLFADFTYEGSRSIIPQFFTTTLGGSVFLLGIVLGLGEFVGYAFRLVSGKLADVTHRYWQITFIGYAINLFVVPLLALSGNFIIAAFLIFAERLGKATRAPSKDYIISAVSARKNMGRSFAINQALDQTGAVIGPLAMSIIILYNGSYREGFAFLAIPAMLAMLFLFTAYMRHRNVASLSKREPKDGMMSSKRFILYSIAVAVSAAGMYQTPFVLFGAQGSVDTYLIPTIFLMAMIGEGLFGFVFGMLYDRIGRTLVYAGLLSAAIIPFILLNHAPTYFFVAALAIGATMGIQDTVMRAVVGTMIPKERRGFSYGIFNSFYGFGIMVSSVLVGYLYHSLGTIAMYVIVAQVIAFVLLAASFRQRKE